jgi:hypothetical protein
VDLAENHKNCAGRVQMTKRILSKSNWSRIAQKNPVLP